MPLRLLMYIARVYEKIISRRKIYHSKIETIPAPEFIVLYNGKKPYPDHVELKLSTAFKDTDGLKENNEVSLELKLQVYNINHGHNPEILKKGGALYGYSFFVEKVREYEKGLPFEEALRKAVKYCIEHNILRKFLKKHGSEVYKMALWGWDIEEARAAWYEEATEKGLEEGLERGIEQGIERGIEQGRGERDIEVARNALAEGFPIETVHRITGLDLETIENIQLNE